MQQVLFYLIQVILCSGIFYAYYLAVLRNKKFHQYNRYYLLSAMCMSWLIPMLRINVESENIITAQPVIQPRKVWEIIADNNTEFENYVVTQTRSYNITDVIPYLYGLITVVLIGAMLLQITKIVMEYRKQERSHLENDILIVYSTLPKAPFSFFRWIFWNPAIDTNTEVGQRILQHEIAHIKQKHTIDNLVSYIMLSIGWINPFFWLMRKELNIVHEFIADQYAAESDAAELASMLLTVSYPSSALSINNYFFQSPIKRRIKMITSKHPGFSYLRRVLILPVIAVVLMVLSFRSTGNQSLSNINAVVNDTPVISDVTLTKVNSDDKVDSAIGTSFTEGSVRVSNISLTSQQLKHRYRIMIDAGHGGTDAGAVSRGGMKESDIALQFAKEIKAANRNENIELVFTRESDKLLTPAERLKMIRDQQVDLVVSLHVNTASVPDSTGLEIYLPGKKEKANYSTSPEFGFAVAFALSSIKGSEIKIKRREAGVYVLDNAGVPAILVEMGYLSNAADLKQMNDPAYRRKLVKAILYGIETYLNKFSDNQ